MTPTELQEVKERGIVPRQPRPCVLCYRRAFFENVINIRANKNRLEVNPNFSYQIYRNPITGDGAYRSDAVLRPLGTEYEGFLDILVRHERGSLQWYVLFIFWLVGYSYSIKTLAQ